MPSKYYNKQPKAKLKQDATLPYKRHWFPKNKIEMCSNCGNMRNIKSSYSKCRCGGTYQYFKGELPSNA